MRTALAIVLALVVLGFLALVSLDGFGVGPVEFLLFLSAIVGLSVALWRTRSA